MDIAAFLSGLGGVLAGSGILATWLRSKAEELAELKRELKEDHARRLTAVEARVDWLGRAEAAHDLLDERLARAEEQLRVVNVPLIDQKIDTLGRQLTDIELKLDRCMEETARLSERLRPARARLGG